MLDIAAHPIIKRWPAQHPDRIQPYSLATPNGVNVSIALGSAASARITRPRTI